ncbi:MAG TPA: hypothetical protein PKM21_15965 [Anaerolineales bacterium]|nr:hypothetical protein [Anaerolineales bacterium]
MNAQTSFLDTLFQAPVTVAAPGLPDGWTVEDIKHLLEKLDQGPILVSSASLGVPTIQDSFGVEIDHAGFGLMVGKGPGFKLSFDAGGAMNRTPSGKGWSYLKLEGECPYVYDTEGVRRTLQSYLPPEPGTLGHQVSVIMAKAAPEPEPPAEEPWEMTRHAYQMSRAKYANGIPILNGADADAHRESVCQALANGEEVAWVVLRDYPDLGFTLHYRPSNDSGDGYFDGCGYLVMYRDPEHYNEPGWVFYKGGDIILDLPANPYLPKAVEMAEEFIGRLIYLVGHPEAFAQKWLQHPVVHTDPDDFWGEPISSYSRAEALSDGEMVDVTETAREAGWKYPVAITAALAGACTPTEEEKALGQSFDGRLWDVLWMAILAAKASPVGTDTIRFRVIIAEASPDAEDGVKHVEHELYAVCGPGDTPEPVVTIGFPLDF